MDMSALAAPAFTWEFAAAVFSIILIDLVLAGDNAVVIAMAVQKLPAKQRAAGIALGAGFAVVLRIVLTFFAAQLLTMPYVKFVGGLLIYWIAIKLLLGDSDSEESGKEAGTIWEALWIIVVADITMSTDNILALAGASKGSLSLLLFGLILSIPLVVCASSLLAKLMSKYPIIIYGGAAVLGKVAAELAFTDSIILPYIALSKTGLIIAEVLGAVSVLVVAKLYLGFVKGRKRASTEPDQVIAEKIPPAELTRKD
jgi:YjbE family integral membrane protein